jgi:hypothetical protein
MSRVATRPSSRNKMEKLSNERVNTLKKCHIEAQTPLQLGRCPGQRVLRGSGNWAAATRGEVLLQVTTGARARLGVMVRIGSFSSGRLSGLQVPPFAEHPTSVSQ